VNHASRKDAIGAVSQRARLAELLLQGAETKEIAAQLRISVRTVKSYLARLFFERGITTGCKRVKLVVILYREQLAALDATETADHLSGMRGDRQGRPLLPKTH
jgi:DNA-binding NarL/FixJ family response regulator